jgi:D-3-phosphoglycerate dehydrogenase
MIGAAELAVMKPTAYLILTARGGVVDEPALVDALRTGTIAGAGIDTWVSEPVQPSDPLLAFDNVIATPHSAFFSEESITILRQRFAESAVDVCLGVTPRSLVNPEVASRRPLSPRPSEGDA